MSEQQRFLMMLDAVLELVERAVTTQPEYDTWLPEAQAVVDRLRASGIEESRLLWMTNVMLAWQLMEMANRSGRTFEEVLKQTRVDAARTRVLPED